MTVTIYETIQLRRGTAAAWAAANPVLASGEPGVETDTGKMKLGDGLTHWNSLLYQSGPYNYTATLTADGTIPFLSTIMVCTIDPNGADRIVTPVSGFTAGSVIMIRNSGANAITFSSGAFSGSIGGGNKNFFTFDGTNWG